MRTSTAILALLSVTVVVLAVATADDVKSVQVRARERVEAERCGPLRLRRSPLWPPVAQVRRRRFPCRQELPLSR